MKNIIVIRKAYESDVTCYVTLGNWKQVKKKVESVTALFMAPCVISFHSSLLKLIDKLF